MAQQIAGRGTRSGLRDSLVLFDTQHARIL